jgi:hypothetical protein
MARPKKTQPLINIESLHALAKANVKNYFDIVEQISFLIDKHPDVSKHFLVNTILNSFGVSDEWFMDMQEHHKQSIIDSVRGKHE